MRKIISLFLIIFPFVSFCLEAKELQIAVAANMSPVIDELKAAFEKQNPGTTLKITLGSSGNLFAQIKHQAPYDVFISADMVYPEKLVSEGAAVTNSLTPYAIGYLALWTKNDAIDIKNGLSSLTSPAVKKIAMANPDLAPYGLATKTAFEKLRLWNELQGKIVYGENIAQTAQFAQTGNADVAVISLSLALSDKLKGTGKYVKIDPTLYDSLIQGAIITKQSRNQESAARFMEFLKSEECRVILSRFGFGKPQLHAI